MFEANQKIKRQIEILGMCLLPQKFQDLSTTGLGIFYGVEELTIKRDLSELRNYGIDIHSINKRVSLTAPLNPQQLTSIIQQYAGLSYAEHPILDRSSSLLVSKLEEKALSVIVQLQICIDKGLKAVIEYTKEGEKIEKKEIIPLSLFQNDGCWRILGENGGRIKQYLLEKVTDVTMTEQKHDIGYGNLEEMLANTWKSWIEKKSIKVKLHLSKVWAERISPRIMIKNQKITPNNDGSALFEVEVNSLSEIGGWIVSRGEGITVLEPEELKLQVIKLAQGALKNYEV